jgi:hypothetical protein
LTVNWFWKLSRLALRVHGRFSYTAGMISRKTAKRVAEAYTLAYSYYSHPLYYLNRDKLHDFLYEEDYESWFLNLIKRMSEHALNNRELKEFLMRLHTGESVVATQWTWEDRRKLGQRYLKDLAEDIINVYEKKPYEQYGNTEKVIAVVKTLKAQLELDVSLPRLGPRISSVFRGELLPISLPA